MIELQGIDGPKIRATVTRLGAVIAALNGLLDRGRWMEFVPLPFDNYWIIMKDEYPNAVFLADLEERYKPNPAPDYSPVEE